MNETIDADNIEDHGMWRVAVALALKSGLDWGRCRNVCPGDKWRTGGGRCFLALGHSGMCSSYEHGGNRWSDATPVPAPWDHDAYRADCARRGVEPGPMPALSWLSEDGRVSWTVDGDYIRIRVDAVVLAITSSRGWYADAAGHAGPVETWAKCVQLAAAAAAAKAMEP